MQALIYGKHPAYGDFLTHGLSPDKAAYLDNWLESVLPVMQSSRGDTWEQSWINAHPVRFWLGPCILDAPMSGVFMCSIDKVGRRYPLIFGLIGAATPPPTATSFSNDLHDALWKHVIGFEMQDTSVVKGASSLLEGFVFPDVNYETWEPGRDDTIFAENKELNTLLKDAEKIDGQFAQLNRSHWWRSQTETTKAGWLSCTNMPNAENLEWLLFSKTSSDQAH